MTNDFLDDLQWRGLIHQCTDFDALAAKLNAGSVTLYCGFDPTAESLHVGNLIPLISLARFQRAGHRALALVGGATGLIGDPSGKTDERVLQTAEQVTVRTAFISRQLGLIVDTTDPDKGKVVNNLDWTRNLSVLDFLRDVGKHFSVNAMIQRDSVRTRLTREGAGISFTEFSYMLLQGFDFLKLAELEGCSLQIGGSDQWGNMCSGADLIRRKLGGEAFALTFPLLTNSDGQKFGKSVNGAVWLDKSKTSEWDFFQFWQNTADADVIRLLKLFTFLPRANIEQLEREVRERPQGRVAQRMLAEAMTELVHGCDAAKQMVQVAGVLFSKQGGIESLTAETFEMLSRAAPLLQVKCDEPLTLASMLVKSGLETSMTKANRLIKQSPAVSVNNRPLLIPDFVPAESDWLHGRFLLVKKGKKHFAIIERLNR